MEKIKVFSDVFLDYIKENGFKPENKKIIELYQSAPDSISRYLKDSDTYLLSDSVNYDELDAMGLNGARGHIENGMVVIPKSIINDKRFLQASKKTFMNHAYPTPSLSEFDTIIANYLLQNNGDFTVNPNLNQDLFLGFCANKEQVTSATLTNYKKILFTLNYFSHSKFEIKTDTVSCMQLCLIKRK